MKMLLRTGLIKLEQCWVINTKKISCFCTDGTEVTWTPTRPVDNVVIAKKGLKDRNICIIAGTTVENKGKLILILSQL